MQKRKPQQVLHNRKYTDLTCKPLKASSSSDPTYSSEFRLEEETSLDVFCSFILFCIDELIFTWSVSLWIWVKQKRMIFWSWTRRRGTWRWVWWQKWVSLFHIISFYDLLQTLRDRCQKFLLSGAAGERDRKSVHSNHKWHYNVKSCETQIGNYDGTHVFALVSATQTCS